MLFQYVFEKDIKMKMDRKPFFKVARLIVCVWMGTMIGSLYFLEKTDEHPGADSAISTNYGGNCDDGQTFNGTFQENLQKLKNIVFSESLPWIQRLDSITTTRRSTASFPVLVTAANARFYIRSQGLIKGIIDKLMPVYKDLKIIYFDLGLNSVQRETMEKHCKCEIRKLPPEMFPTHVQDANNYAFKPVIIYLMYKEFGHVWWLDASARFVNRDLDLPLKYLKEKGILFFTFDQTASIAAHTDMRTFHYFNENPCLYTHFGEVDASTLAFRKSRVNDVILRQWLSCALDQKCIAPKDAKKYCESGKTSPKKTFIIGRCHRFDQSALGIILRRLYHKQNHYPPVEVPFKIIEIRRKEDITFFFSK